MYTKLIPFQPERNPTFASKGAEYCRISVSTTSQGLIPEYPHIASIVGGFHTGSRLQIQLPVKICTRLLVIQGASKVPNILTIVRTGGLRISLPEFA